MILINILSPGASASRLVLITVSLGTYYTNSLSSTIHVRKVKPGLKL